MQWKYFRGDGHLPPSGWKIHVGSSLRHAGETVARVRAYSISRGLHFKTIADDESFLTLNGQHAPRTSSGKLATIYPRSTAESDRIARELMKVLRDLDPGPAILTDHRCGESAVHLRYGGYVEKYLLTEEGARTPAMMLPDGSWVPDERPLVPELPTDMPYPSVLERPSQGHVEVFPVEIVSAIRHSSAGGVYVGVDRDRAIAAKEARPMAGYDDLGRDAVVRLSDEARILAALTDVSGVVDAQRMFEVGGHHFLVMPLLSGPSLEERVAKTLDEFWYGGRISALGYVREMSKVLDEVRATVSEIHVRGLTVGDIAPQNIILTTRGPVLIDMGTAAHVGTPASRTRTLLCESSSFASTESDASALRALTRFVFWPSSRQAPDDDSRLLRWAALVHGIGSAPTKELAALLGIDLQSLPAESPSLPNFQEIDRALAGALEDAISAGSRPLAYSLLNGEAGLAAALGPGPEAAGEMIRQAVALAERDRNDGTFPPGLGDGAAGLSLACAAVDDWNGAHRMINAAWEALAHVSTVGIYAGTAGVLLADSMLAKASDSATILGRDRKSALIDRVLEALSAPQTWSTPGWLHGAAGLAHAIRHAGEGHRLDEFDTQITRLTDAISPPTRAPRYLEIDGRRDPYLASGAAGVLLGVDASAPQGDSVTYVDNESLLVGLTGLLLTNRSAGTVCEVTSNPWFVDCTTRAVASLPFCPKSDALERLSLGYGLAGTKLADPRSPDILRSLIMWS